MNLVELGEKDFAVSIVCEDRLIEFDSAELQLYKIVQDAINENINILLNVFFAIRI